MSILTSLHLRGPRFARRSFLAAGLGALLLSGPAAAEQVDAEFILLVDVSNVVTATDFSDLLNGYATAFESALVVDAIQSKSTDGLAASVVFLGAAGNEAVAVPWMKITDASSMGDFANALRSAPRPVIPTSTSVASGLDFATEQFGTETGFGANGFESHRQGITVTSETTLPVADPSAAVLAARDNSLLAGVEVIHGITIGQDASALATAYYEAFIVGGQSWGLPGGVTNAPDYPSLASVAAGSLHYQFLTLAPEPSISMLTVVALAGLTLRRRRSA